jgi:hypothetical protein
MSSEEMRGSATCIDRGNGDRRQRRLVFCVCRRLGKLEQERQDRVRCVHTVSKDSGLTNELGPEPTQLVRLPTGTPKAPRVVSMVEISRSTVRGTQAVKIPQQCGEHNKNRIHLDFLGAHVEFVGETFDSPVEGMAVWVEKRVKPRYDGTQRYIATHARSSRGSSVSSRRG